MMVYKPMHVGDHWEVWELDPSLLKHMTGSTCAYYRPKVGFYGTLYNEDTIFRSEEAARKWINKEYVPKEDYYRVLSTS